MASPDTIILYYCGSQKNEKFLTHVLVYETKFAVEKWQVLVFTSNRKEEKAMGVKSTLGGFPQAVTN